MKERCETCFSNLARLLSQTRIPAGCCHELVGLREEKKGAIACDFYKSQSAVSENEKSGLSPGHHLHITGFSFFLKASFNKLN